MKKSFKKSNGLGTQTVFDNTVEKKPVSRKEFYTTMNINGKDHMFTCYGTRREAVVYFEEQARLHGSTFNIVKACN